MNEKKEFLNEENYEKGKKKIKIIALVILIIGLLLGGSLIATGLIKQGKINDKYSDSSKANQLEKLENEKNKISEEIETEKQNILTSKSELETKRSAALATEKQKLETKKAELTAKGIKYDVFAKYDDGESYDLKIVTRVLDPSMDYCAFDEYENNTLTSAYCLISNMKDETSKNLNVIEEALDTSFDYCAFDEAKNNSYTSKYCSLKNQLKQKNSEISNLDSEYSDFTKKINSSGNIAFYMIGGFIIVASCMMAGSIYMFAKRREMLAFTAQQVMPVAQEGMEKMAPTVGKVGASIAKEMAPVYGEIAKEISKGIKEGQKEAEDSKK